jgi:hypothetical protein
MPATAEQWEEIQSLKGAHKAQLEAFDRECSDRRFEIERSHDEAFNDLYRRMNARRDRSTPDALARGRVKSDSFNPNRKGERDGTSP